MDLESISRKRIAFFGGSFDPPHLGHLGIARAAQAALGLDTVLFAPVGAQPLKPQGPTAGFEDRLAMTRLAIAAEPGFYVSLVDAPRPSGEPNYTLETLLALRAQLPPEGALFCLMGADAFAGLKSWHRAAEVPFAASLIVASRPFCSPCGLDDLMAFLPDGLALEGQGLSPDTNRANSSRDSRFAVKLDSESILCQGTTSVVPQMHQIDRGALASDGCSSKAQVELRRYLLSNPAREQAPLYLLSGLDFEISASEIREGMRQQAAAGARSPKPVLLPASVSEYIRARNLYC